MGNSKDVSSQHIQNTDTSVGKSKSIKRKKINQAKSTRHSKSIDTFEIQHQFQRVLNTLQTNNLLSNSIVNTS